MSHRVFYNPSATDVEVSSLGFTVTGLGEYDASHMNPNDLANDDDLIGYLSAGTLELRIPGTTNSYPSSTAVAIVAGDGTPVDDENVLRRHNFIGRFTFVEAQAFEQSTIADVVTVKFLMSFCEWFDSGDTMLGSWMDILVTNSILTQARRDAILTV